jgi:threonine synthase
MTMAKVFLRAVGDEQSAKKYPVDKARVCADDGRLLEVVNNLKPMNPAKVARLKKMFEKRAGSLLPIDRSGVWRYREFLPAFKPYYTAITLFEGNSPVYSLPQCASLCGVQNLLAKHEGNNPTGSIGDLGMTAAVTMAKLLDIPRIACASTGHGAASMAAYAARAGMKCIAFIPDGVVTAGNFSQILEYGALTLQIAGDFDTTRKIAEEVCVKAGIYSVNSSNPFVIEGQKTIVIDMLRQLGWQVPGWIVVPDGSLGTTAAIGKILAELKTVGFMDTIPRLAVIQAEGANPFYSSVTNNSWPVKAMQTDTRAVSIKVGDPVNVDQARSALKFTNGLVEQVQEHEIAMAKCYLGKDGVAADPASAAAIAGCKKLMSKGMIQPEETVVCLLTGNVLKDPDYTREYHLDNLFRDTVRTIQYEASVRIPTYGIFNRPVKMPADAGKVLEYVQSRG